MLKRRRRPPFRASGAHQRFGYSPAGKLCLVALGFFGDLGLGGFSFSICNRCFFAGRADEVGQVDLIAGGVGNLGLLQDLGEGLAAADFADHHRNLATLVNELGELVRIHAVLAGGGHDVVDQLVLADADLFLVGNSVKDDFVLEGGGRVLANFGTVLFGVVVLALGLTAAFSAALGAEAGFVARTHDMDRKHMMETFRRAHDHQGSAFVEIYQNCNVFNDAAFEGTPGSDADVYPADYPGVEGESAVPPGDEDPSTYVEPNKDTGGAVRAEQVHRRADGTDYVNVDQLPSDHRYFRYQAIVNEGGTPTEMVIDQTRQQKGREYRDETEGAHPVPDLRPQNA